MTLERQALSPPRVLMVGPFPPAVGGLANNMNLLMASSLGRRFTLIPFSTAKRRRNIFPNRPALDSFPYLVFHTLKLFVWMMRYRPEVVYLKTTSDTGFFRDGCLLAVVRLWGRPALTHLHGRPRGRLFSTTGAWTALPRWGLRLSRATVVLSPGLATQFAVMFPNQPLFPVPNVVDVTRFHPGGNRDGSRIRILTVGRVSREKGTWDLLQVAAELLDGPTCEFRLCGIGETPGEEQALKQRAADLGLAHKVVFLGTVRGEALVREFQDADVFFLPTYAEIFPNVVLEALASGLPVVTTDVPVIPEMFTEGAEGFRHSPGDVAGMAASLRKLAVSAELRKEMGRAARELAESRYGVESAAEAIGDLLDAVRRRKPLPSPAVSSRQRASS